MGPVVEGIMELDQLATVRWTEFVPVTRETGGDILDRLFSGEKVIVIATGKVEAGVDLGDIDKDQVSVNGDGVTVDLPEPEILYCQPRRGENPRLRPRLQPPEHPP